MSELLAGFGCVEITPDNMGFPLLGYGTREHGTRVGNSEGIHDRLWARAFVVRQGESAWALCMLDMLGVDTEVLSEVRRRASRLTGLAPEAILIAAIHTHSAPSALDAGNWNRPLAERVADAVVQAWASLEPARVAAGAGSLYAYSINRRWLDRPIDPGVGVLRFDNVAGKPLGTVVNFGLHAVVLGGDNLQISADYVGYMRCEVEQAVGGICIFCNGGAGDVNPLTETVRRQLAEGRHFVTMTGTSYYGEGPDAVYIEERKGGTFVEAEILGRALAAEVIRVSRGLVTRKPERAPWHVQAWANRLAEGEDLIEIHALGVGSFGLVTEPGEVFSETALGIKADLRRLGFRFPWVVSYANGYHSYLAPGTAHVEGGYEAECAKSRGNAQDVQERIWAAIRPLLPSLA